MIQLGALHCSRIEVLITSNRSVGEWGSVFGDPVVATAILDRLLHHSQVINHPWRQLSPAREAPLRPDQGLVGRHSGDRLSPWIIVT